MKLLPSVKTPRLTVKQLSQILEELPSNMEIRVFGSSKRPPIATVRHTKDGVLYLRLDSGLEVQPEYRTKEVQIR